MLVASCDSMTAIKTSSNLSTKIAVIVARDRNKPEIAKSFGFTSPAMHVCTFHKWPSSQKILSMLVLSMLTKCTVIQFFSPRTQQQPATSDDGRRRKGDRTPGSKLKTCNRSRPVGDSPIPVQPGDTHYAGRRKL